MKDEKRVDKKNRSEENEKLMTRTYTNILSAVKSKSRSQTSTAERVNERRRERKKERRKAKIENIFSKSSVRLAYFKFNTFEIIVCSTRWANNKRPFDAHLRTLLFCSCRPAFTTWDSMPNETNDDVGNDAKQKRQRRRQSKRRKTRRKKQTQWTNESVLRRLTSKFATKRK